MNDRRMKLLPSLKPKKRYVVFEIQADQKFSFSDVNELVEGALLLFLGLSGLAKATPLLLKEKFNKKRQRFILKVNNNYVDEIIAALALSKKIKKTSIIIKSIIVSGTLKKASSHLDK